MRPIRTSTTSSWRTWSASGRTASEARIQAAASAAKSSGSQAAVLASAQAAAQFTSPQSRVLVEQMKTLLALWQDRTRASADVKRLAMAHVAELEEKAAAIRAMTDAFVRLAGSGSLLPRMVAVGDDARAVGVEIEVAGVGLIDDAVQAI